MDDRQKIAVLICGAVWVGMCALGVFGDDGIVNTSFYFAAATGIIIVLAKRKDK